MLVYRIDGICLSIKGDYEIIYCISYVKSSGKISFLKYKENFVDYFCSEEDFKNFHEILQSTGSIDLGYDFIVNNLNLM